MYIHIFRFRISGGRLKKPMIVQGKRVDQNGGKTELKAPGVYIKTDVRRGHNVTLVRLCVVVCRNVFQCVSMVQCAAVCCSVQCVAVCSVLQCVTVRCSLLQFAAVCCTKCCIVLRNVTLERSLISVWMYARFQATHCNILQHAALCCNALQHSNPHTHTGTRPRIFGCWPRGVCSRNEGRVCRRRFYWNQSR